LLERVAALRRQVATELGIIVPAVRVRDNPELSANDYLIKIKGLTVSRGVTYLEQFLAVDRGDATAALPDAEESSEPYARRLAYWITESQVRQAESLVYAIVPASDVLVSHLGETIRSHAHELPSRQ